MTQKKSSNRRVVATAKKGLQTLVNIFFVLIFVSFFVILIYMAVAGLFRGHEALETTPSLITQQAEYEKDFTTEGASFDNPKVILNPYKNSPLTALVIFKSDNEITPSVTIEGKDEYTSISHNFTSNTEHFLPIYGLYPDYNNKVTISYQKDDETISKQIDIKTEPLPENVAKADITTVDKANLDNSLYFFSPSSKSLAAAYDINGDVRWYLTQTTSWDNKRLKNGHILISTERIINTPYYMTGMYEIDLLGKIYKEYSIPGGYHHDYFEMPNGNLLVASDNFSATNDTVEDYLVEIDHETGEIAREFDLKRLIPTQNTGNENYSSADWFHNNSVWYDENTNSIILSGRHADAVVSMDYDTATLNWIIGDPTGWPESLQKYFFTPVGEEFEWQWSQHAAMVTPEGYIFLFDNGNNKSKNKEAYVPASSSYSRGVMYKIDTNSMTIEQIYQYGKERGSDFYSPYISDVDYFAEGHYLISSGGISSKDGEPQNQPAGVTQADTLLSDTVEILNGETIFEIKLKSNTYRAEKLQAYYDGENFQLGKGQKLGHLAKSETNNTEFGLLTDTKNIDDSYNSHNISLAKEEDRLSLSGTFTKGSNLRIILTKGFEKRFYKFKVTNEAHAALCVAVFDTEGNATREDINITRYINAEGLSGTYNIYLEIGDDIYDTSKSVKF